MLSTHVDAMFDGRASGIGRFATRVPIIEF
jgi:hypothetical protein